MTTITITINGEPRQLPAGSTLADVLAASSQPAASFASAVNGEFVARDARAIGQGQFALLGVFVNIGGGDGIGHNAQLRQQLFAARAGRS